MPHRKVEPAMDGMSLKMRIGVCRIVNDSTFPVFPFNLLYTSLMTVLSGPTFVVAALAVGSVSIDDLVIWRLFRPFCRLCFEYYVVMELRARMIANLGGQGHWD